MEHYCNIKVRPYECDSNNHVNNAVYLNYLEHARMEYLNDIKFDYKAFTEAGFGVFIAKININYKGPAFLNDELTIHTKTTSKKLTSGTFNQIIKKDDTIITEADVTWVCVNSQGKPVKMPEGFNFNDIRN